MIVDWSALAALLFYQRMVFLENILAFYMIFLHFNKTIKLTFHINSLDSVAQIQSFNIKKMLISKLNCNLYAHRKKNCVSVSFHMLLL